MSEEDSIDLKQRFPRVTLSQIRQAIEENIIQPEDKDNILRNPNQFTIFRIKFNTQSPRTQNAMKEMSLVEDDLSIMEYRDYVKNQPDTLKNVITYLQYLTEKYKNLSDLLKRRNQLKHLQFNTTKMQQSKNMLFKEDDATVMLTEMPDQRMKMDFQQYSNQTTPVHRKDNFKKKLTKETENYNKFLGKVVDIAKHQQEYYTKTAPETYQKVEKNKKVYLDQVKRKVHKNNLKVEKVLQKTKEKQYKEIKQHSQIVENIAKNLDEHNNRKIKIVYGTNEQSQMREERDKQRQMKRVINQQNEDSMISQVMNQLKSKTDYLNEYLQMKHKVDQQKYEQNLKMFEEKQNKLQQIQQEKEQSRVQQFVNKSAQRYNQLALHDKNQQKLQKVLSLKNSRISQKYESFQQDNERKWTEKVASKLQQDDTRQQIVLKRFQNILLQLDINR
ncbi:hypothetical protein pb186bvf_006068 [Paramecium bursaria]